MKVADVMSRGVELVPPDATVQSAATKMAEDDVGAVWIGRGDTLEGILTDRDIIIRAVVEGRDMTTLPVRDIMSTTLFTCREGEDVEAVFRQMTERQVRRLPVFDESDKLIGVVTLSDLALAGDPRQIGDLLRAIAEPHRRRSVPADAATVPPDAATAAPDAPTEK
jgi:CBS domain-containing protein